ncbi:hypothetical protein [Halorientalis regularis]|uniref:Uncharacterized protein n=1 Tax=Halorientalis regularis TaxID=660518 RepID=A0A1G7QFY1_9EURY|nr:hypothetical protein [Halorientalis regularis]SDF96829.1 hypothetical protein SAMN05216218_112106 [Halorientalis regularis]
MSRRTTFNKHKRACAYAFPLDAFNRGGRPTDDTHSEQPSVTSETTEDGSDEQQQLDVVADQSPESGEETGVVEESEAASGAHDVGGEENAGGGGENAAAEVRARLQRAIDALQEVEDAL